MSGKSFDRKRRSKIEDVLLVGLCVGDVALFLAAQLLAYWVRFYSGWLDGLPFEDLLLVAPGDEIPVYRPHFVLGTFFFLAIGIYFRIFSSASLLHPRRALGDVAHTCFAWLLFYLLLSLVFRVEPPISRVFMILTAGIGLILIFAWREFYTQWIRRSGLVEALRRRVLVVGWTNEAQKIYERIQNIPHSAHLILRAVPSAGVGFERQPPPELVQGDTPLLSALIRPEDFDIVLLADLNPTVRETNDLVNLCHKEMVSFMAIPAFFDVLISGVETQSLYGVPTITIGRLPLDFLPAKILKRAMDIVGGLVGLVLSAPIIAIFAAIVYRENPGPVIYAQTRTGRRGQTFRIYKIRSMRLDAEQATGARWASEDDDRRLRVGAFMRRWNIDELPQFWNVLRGDMSLVGPRPERPEFISKFKEDVMHYNIRLTVKPGLTGWAAVNGLRGNTDLNARVQLDIEYIERWSLGFDFYIMALTFVNNKNAY